VLSNRQWHSCAALNDCNLGWRQAAGFGGGAVDLVFGFDPDRPTARSLPLPAALRNWEKVWARGGNAPGARKVRPPML